MTKFLPYRLSNDPGFLPRNGLQELIRLACKLEKIEEIETGTERYARIRMHAAQFLKSHKSYGSFKAKRARTCCSALITSPNMVSNEGKGAGQFGVLTRFPGCTTLNHIWIRQQESSEIVC